MADQLPSFTHQELKLIAHLVSPWCEHSGHPVLGKLCKAVQGLVDQTKASAAEDEVFLWTIAKRKEEYPEPRGFSTLAVDGEKKIGAKD
jgi:hypothetical protein